MTGINSQIFLQVEIAHLYMRRHKLTPEQFLALDEEYGVLHFLDIGYEPYHLTGREGVLAEIEKIVEEQRFARAGESVADTIAQS
ncbi:MAG: DUF3791 domain-containing protein [Peptococcaceae bacterium]|jgi:hypothetical protein|nr:DUF3791 domain-containing protein [Peptococcaceae bacterium]